MKVNYSNNTIEMTKTETKEASNPNSNTFKELIKLKTLFPDFTIATKSSTRRASSFKGLDYDFMARYIEKHDENKTIIKEFYELRGLDENGNRDPLMKTYSFGEIKMWFLDTYPEIESHNSKTDDKLRKIKERRIENKKVA